MGIFGWIMVICAALFALCVLACILLIPIVLLSGGLAALLRIFRAPAQESPGT